MRLSLPDVSVLLISRRGKICSRPMVLGGGGGIEIDGIYGCAVKWHTSSLLYDRTHKSERLGLE